MTMPSRPSRRLLMVGAVLALLPLPAAAQIDIQLVRTWMAYDYGGDATFAGGRLGLGWWPRAWLRVGADVERWGDLDGAPATAGHVSLSAFVTPVRQFDLYTTWSFGRIGRAAAGITPPLEGRATRVAVGAAVGPTERYRVFSEVGLRDDDGASDAEIAVGGRFAFGPRPQSAPGPGGGQVTLGLGGFVSLHGPYASVEPVYSIGWRGSPSRETAGYADATLLHVDGRGFDTRAFWLGGGMERRLGRGSFMVAPGAGVGLLLFPEGADGMLNVGFALGATAQTTGSAVGLGVRTQVLIVPLQGGGAQTSLLAGGFVTLGR